MILQLLPSCYLFAALLKHTLIAHTPLHAAKPYLLANGLAGMLATMVGLGVAFVPSRQVNSIWLYELKLIAGCALVFGSAYFFYWRARRFEPVPDAIAAVAPLFSESGESAV